MNKQDDFIHELSQAASDAQNYIPILKNKDLMNVLIHRAYSSILSADTSSRELLKNCLLLQAFFTAFFAEPYIAHDFELFSYRMAHNLEKFTIEYIKSTVKQEKENA